MPKFSFSSSSCGNGLYVSSDRRRTYDEFNDDFLSNVNAMDDSDTRSRNLAGASATGQHTHTNTTAAALQDAQHSESMAQYRLFLRGNGSHQPSASSRNNRGQHTIDEMFQHRQSLLSQSNTSGDTAPSHVQTRYRRTFVLSVLDQALEIVDDDHRVLLEERHIAFVLNSSHQGPRNEHPSDDFDHSQ